MKKRYNIYIVSRLYLKNYYRFLLNETNVRKSSDAYDLFMYSIKKIHGLESVEYCGAISKYGNACIKALENTENTPKNKKNLPYEDKIRVVSLCEGYAQVTGLLSQKAILNGRT